ncbi:MAG: Fic family protein [Clostridia bacterium]|nr:Fic family protein [Clostridia bacterium]
MSYIPPYQITDKVLALVADISEKIGKITERTNLDSKPHLRKNNKIKSIHSSLKIEANSLSLDEVRDVINGRTVMGERKEIQEVKNAYAAYEEIGKFDVYNLNDFKRLHGVMTKYIVEESGCFRKGEEGVFNGDKCIFMAPPAKFVPEQMQNLFDWMQKSRDTVHPLILAAVFHYEFVFIHPFTDGNGRMARLWHTAILTQWKPIFEFIPIESQIEKFQDGYYNAIAQCHIDGTSTVFIEFILEQISAILSEILSLAGDSIANLSEYVKRLLSVMEYDTPYTANAILDLLKLKSKETLRKNYLNPAIEDGLVKMTLPDKPNSRNQRYIKI